MQNKKPLDISHINKCLKIRRIGERGRKQGKFPTLEIFSAGLSTETVDSFLLALTPLSLQQRRESKVAAKGPVA